MSHAKLSQDKQSGAQPSPRQVELSEMSRVKPSQVEPSGGGLIRVEPIQAKLSQAKMNQIQLSQAEPSPRDGESNQTK